MKIVFAPDWFLTTDVTIEFFSFIVLLIFFILCNKSYKTSGNKKTKNLGRGFLLISLAQLATILTKFVLYDNSTAMHNIGDVMVAYNVVKSIDIFYYIGFFFHRLLTLLGLYLIYRIYLTKKSETDMLLVSYFLIVSVFISQFFYYIFHLSALILLILIIWNYCKVYKKNKNINTKRLIIALGIMAFAQLVFIFSIVKQLYIAGQILELVSYLILLSLIIRILKYGKEKN